MRRMFVWGAVLTVTLVAASLIAGRMARARLLAHTPPPGKLVDVGGYRLHLWCTGVGEPTVVLEAGLLDFSLFWTRVQPAVASTTRTCSYDRAGSGWSDPSPAARTSEEMVRELRTLLATAHLRPPYVLVGHSFGGLNARLFSYGHPDEVAGLVLVDAAHEEQWTRIPELRTATEGLAGQFRLLGRLADAGLLALAPGMIPDRGLPAAAADQYRALLAGSAYFGRVAAELESVPASAAQVRAARGAARSAPATVVISRGRTAPLPGLSADEQVRVEARWRAMQDELAAAARIGSPVIARESGHDVHLQQPGLVIDAIRAVVDRSRAVRPLAQ